MRYQYRKRKPKGQSAIDNPETSETYGTHETSRSRKKNNTIQQDTENQNDKQHHHDQKQVNTAFRDYRGKTVMTGFVAHFVLCLKIVNRNEDHIDIRYMCMVKINVHRTSPCFDTSVRSQESEWSCICVLVVSILHFYLLFIN